jgi:hypothetical protein
MPRGGSRPGAGRKQGSASRRSQEVTAAIIETGELPLEYMLKVVRDENADQKRRDAMAIAAAPYVHPRLATIDGDLNLHLHKHEEALAELE